MNYYKIKKYDIANGKGLRTTIYFSGCKFHCKECFNSELWDFKSGKPFNDETKAYLFELLSDPHCKGLSVLGGEPMEQGEELLELLKEIKELFPKKDIWLWSGYYKNELNSLQQEILSQCDYFIDGRFISEQSNKKLRYRGSENQTVWEKTKNEWIESEYNKMR